MAGNDEPLQADPAGAVGAAEGLLASSSNSHEAPIDALTARLDALADMAWMVREELLTLSTGVHNMYVERMIDCVTSRSLLEEHRARYMYASRYAAGKNVLDMACGSGYGSDYLRGPSGASEVLGVDIDPDAVRYARIRYGRDGLAFQQADACTAWTDRQFDLIVSFETIEHVPYPDQMLDNVVRMLSPSASFIVSTPIRARGAITDRPGNPHHVREWSVAEFTQLMQQYFQDVEIQCQGIMVRDRAGRFRLPRRLVRAYLRSRGYDARAQESLEAGLIPLAETPRTWAFYPPQYLVALCRGHRGPASSAMVKHLCYGGRPPENA
jgi:2-polyprenyl-3-methyl-5-hydroxy-6-metoxy-1,4-benzoquinol methylase